MNRENIESTVINKFLDVLRNNMVDSINPKRTNSNWIRSSVQMRAEPTVNYGRKKYIIKNSAKVKYPLIIVGDFVEHNIVNSIKINNKTHFNVLCELNIRLLDVGHAPSVIGGLGGQVSKILYDNAISVFKKAGIHQLKYNIVSLPGYSDDDNDYNEKEVQVEFVASVEDC